MRRRTNVSAWLLIAPFALSFGVFFAYPLGYSVWLAFHQTFGASASEFVGADNFAWLTEDPQFRIAVTNTLLYTAGSLFIQLPLALGLALLLNRPQMRGRSLYRLVLFSPQVFGMVFAAVLAQVFFAKEGVINQILYNLWFTLDAWMGGRLPDHDLLNIEWLHAGWLPLATLIIISLWMYVGFNMIFFLAALQNVDPQLMECATLDGAGPWQRFCHVTVPAIRPVATFVVLLSVIGSMQLFELPLILFDAMGAGDRAVFIVTYLYDKGFELGDLGLASAVGWLLALVLVGAAIVQRLLSGEEGR